MNNIKEKLEEIVEKHNVFDDEKTLCVYSQDATNTVNSETKPQYVIFVETKEQVQAVMRLANENRIPVIARGAGTNVVGACNPVCGGIIMNFSKMDKILEINKENMTARVEAGVVIGDLQVEVGKLNLMYPPDPSCLKVSTVGGSIALNSAGPKSLKYGATKDYVLELKVVLADGTLITLGSNTIKNSTGYHLNQLFIGSEGTLGIVVEVLFKLIPKPEASRVILAYFDEIEDAIISVNEILENKIVPATIELMDNNVLNTVEKFYPTGLLVDKQAALIVEIDGFECSLDYQQKAVINCFEKHKASGIKFSKTEEEADKIWNARRASYGACTQLKPNVLTDDLIVPRCNMAKLVLGIKSICEKYDLTVCIVGHVGDGNVHPQIALDMEDGTEYENYKKAKKEIYQLVVSLEGVLSGEHGIGLVKKDFLPNVIDNNAIVYMKKIKKIFDENNILNPEKIFD